MSVVCCFTGHRKCDGLDYNLMDRVIANLYKSGCRRFLCGMAQGFDLAAAESVLELKKKRPDTELICCLPCEKQSAYYSAADKRRYARILENCTQSVCLAESYFDGCMQVRDRFMVDNSDTVVCFMRHKTGGTYYTCTYAEKCGKKVIEL